MVNDVREEEMVEREAGMMRKYSDEY